MTTTLTDRQERFVIEYLKDCNASAAAARAGYAAKNKASSGNEVLRQPAVRARVREELRALLAQARSSALALMRQRMRAAFFDANVFFAPDGRVRPAAELDPEARGVLDVRLSGREGKPMLSVRSPNREKALAALEKVHDRLDRLDEEYFNSLPGRGATVEREPGAPIRLPDWLGPLPPWLEAQEEPQGEHEEERPVPPAPSAPAPQTRKPQEISGSGDARARAGAEKPQEMSGSARGAAPVVEARPVPAQPRPEEAAARLKRLRGASAEVEKRQRAALGLKAGETVRGYLEKMRAALDAERGRGKT